ncbi:MAG: HD-GYP domain-containing protein [Thermodesulfobacteriota bacterium]
MPKKISIDELRPGMFVERFGGGWLHHPFLFNRKEIKSLKEVERLRSWGVNTLYVADLDAAGREVQAGPAVADAPAAPALSPPGESEELAQELQLDYQVRRVPLRHELARARQVRIQAHRAARNILATVQAGGRIRTEEARVAVAGLDSSVQQNRDALLVLMQLRKRDEYTFDHSVSVGVLLLALCRSMGLDDETTRSIGLGGLLHDVGKMAVPLEILNKPGALNDDEYLRMKEHVVRCQDILTTTHNIPMDVVRIATEHHERFDGTGYPHGLAGKGISLGGQMAAIADVFDALTSDRCYRNGIDRVEVLRRIYGWRQDHFNEALVHRFIRCIGIYPVGTLVQLESGLIGVVVESTGNLLRPVVRVIYDTRHEWPVHERDIDLSRPDGKGGGDRIVGYESVQRWRINPLKVLGIL